MEEEKRGNRGNIYCTCGKNIIFEEGGGVEISYFGQINTPAQCPCSEVTSPPEKVPNEKAGS